MPVELKDVSPALKRTIKTWMQEVYEDYMNYRGAVEVEDLAKAAVEEFDGLIEDGAIHWVRSIAEEVAQWANRLPDIRW